MKIEAIPYIIVYTVIAIAVLAILLTPVEAAQKYIKQYRAYRKAKKEIEFNIRVWTSIAKSYDPVKEASDKGYAIARIVIYHHDLEELEENRKRELCS